MPRYACPVCGDPNAYPMWLYTDPPKGCPSEPGLRKGRGICSAKLADAKRAAFWRKIAPEYFDARGNILPDGLSKVLRKLEDAKP